MRTYFRNGRQDKKSATGDFIEQFLVRPGLFYQNSPFHIQLLNKFTDIVFFRPFSNQYQSDIFFTDGGKNFYQPREVLEPYKSSRKDYVIIAAEIIFNRYGRN